MPLTRERRVPRYISVLASFPLNILACFLASFLPLCIGLFTYFKTLSQCWAIKFAVWSCPYTFIVQLHHPYYLSIYLNQTGTPIDQLKFCPNSNNISPLC